MAEGERRLSVFLLVKVPEVVFFRLEDTRENTFQLLLERPRLFLFRECAATVNPAWLDTCSMTNRTRE